MAEQRAQRRLAAILAADVVGYSRMMREDEAGTLAQLRTLRKEVFDPRAAEHNGRIVKTTGDGVLVEFGSAVDATECAIIIQRALARRNEDVPDGHRIELRIGINLGDIIVDGDDIYGDGVNVAARLEGLCEPGEVFVSAAVHDQVEGKTNLAFDDLGEHTVKNIDKPIGVYRASTKPRSTTPMGSEVDKLFERPAVAVLPFQNIGGDPDQEYFADGLTEDIITALSLWRSFPVIARNSTFAYKGSSPDVRRVGQELGAHYVVEGSVRKVGTRVRVTFELINAETGHHVWAEKLDRELQDLFALQDEISARISGTIVPELDRAKLSRLQAAQPANLDAWEFYQRGMSLFDEFSGETNRAAREMFLKALELDPTYCGAQAQLALTYHMDLRLEFSESREETLAQLLKNARAAVALDDSDWLAHQVSSLAALWAGEHARALFEGQKSLELNPSGTEAYVSLAAAMDFAGQHAEAIPFCERALQLSPRHPRRVMYETMLARAQFNAGLHDTSASTARKVIQSRPDLIEPQLILVSNLAHSDHESEAAQILEAAKQISPQGIEPPASWKRYAEPSRREHLLDGLRKAGWEG